MLIDYYRLMKYKAPMNRNRLAAFLVSIAVLVLGVVMPPMPPPVAAVAANNYVSVTAFVRMQGPGDCRTQYTLSTVNDRTGNLLYFVASNPVLQNRAFLPFVRR